MSATRNLLGAMLVLSLGLAAAHAQSAADYPSKPIKMIVPYAAGGNMEMWRPTWEKLSQALGQPVVVDYKPGAGGSIGTEALANAAPDGHTLIVGTIGTHAINYFVYPTIRYKPADFSTVSVIGEMPDLVAVHPSVPATSVAELIALAKAKPGELAFGSPGIGSSSHLVGELFSTLTGTRLIHVPYKGSAPEILDLLAGRIQITFDNLPLPLPHIKEGKLRALAVTSAQRAPLLPDVPTLAESGLKDFDVNSWYAVYAPAGTPRPIIEKLSTALVSILKTPEIATPLVEKGWRIVASSPEEGDKFTMQEVARWGEVSKTAGISK